MVQINLEQWKNLGGKIKTEAGKFFNLSFEDKAKDKKMFKIRLEGLLKSQKNMETNLVREILKAKGGHWTGQAL